jgi:hypothetical protein
MADINSLYPQPPAATAPSILTSGDPSKLIGVVNALNEIGAKNAIGGAYSNALNGDGTVDMSKLSEGLRSDPRAAYGLPEAASRMIQQTGGQISNVTGQLEQNAKQNGFIVDSLGALADDPKLNIDKVRSVATTLARNLKIPGQILNGWIDGLPRDPGELRQSLVQMRNLATGAANLSTPTTIGITPQNAPVTGTRGQFNFGAAGADGGGGTVPVAAGGGRTGPGIVTAPAPGVAEAQVQTGAGSGAALNEARQHSLNYQQQVFPLETAIPALEKLGKTGTGPGTEEVNHVKSFLQSAGIPGFDAEKIKNFDEAKKYLTDFVNQNGNSSTNDKLAAAFAGNPSVHISNAAAIDVAKSALALRRMKQAQLVDFEKSGLPDSDYTKRAAQWNINHDPRAYGFDLMSPDQRKKVLESLPKGKRELFMLDVQDALQNGIIKAPGR